MKNLILEMCREYGVNLGNFKFRESPKKDCLFAYYKPLVRTREGLCKCSITWLFLYDYPNGWRDEIYYMKQKDMAFIKEKSEELTPLGTQNTYYL